jgi:hypothetical protein
MISKRHIWTEEEISYLKENFSHNLTSDIAKALNMTESQVSHKAFRLNIQKDKKFKRKVSAELIIKNGFNTRFKKGQNSFNKGKKFNAGG